MASGTKPLDSALEKITSSEAAQTVEKGVKPVQSFARKFANDWAMSFSGLIAYSLLMAMLPIAIALLGILGLVLGSNPTLSQQIIGQITHAFPSAISSQNALQLASAQLRRYGGLLVIIAILLAAFGGSRLFITLEGCLNIVYRLKPRSFIRQNLMAFAMFILFIILIPIMVFSSAAPTIIISLLRHTTLAPTVGSGFFLSLASILGGLIASFILFEAVYFVVPNQPISLRHSWCGALVAAIALEIFLILFPIYVARFLSGYAGTVGFAVILLLFFYYFAVILMLGSEVNAYFFEKVRPLPSDLATLVSTVTAASQPHEHAAEGRPPRNSTPGGRANGSSSATARHKEQETKPPGAQKRRGLASKLFARNKGRAHAKKTQPSSRLPTVLEVVAGSILSLVVAWSRLRHQGK